LITLLSSAHDSPRYGMHYSAEEVAELFAPAQSSVEVITEWLVSAGISAEKISQSANKQWMQFDAASHELEALLKTEYNLFEHSATGKVTVACDEYHVPAHVQDHVDYITPGIKLFASTKKSDSGMKKRTFGVTSGKGKAGLKGPLVKSTGMKLGKDAKFSTEAASPFPCDEVATPQCIASELYPQI
jgi:tripeptidyl-peptidase-1